MWILFSILASIFQTIRNGAQRGLMKNAGVWAATWVRFSFAIPFTFIMFIVFGLLRHNFEFHLSEKFWINNIGGAIAQILATATLLLAMRFSSFAIGIMLQNTTVIMAAIYGAIFLKDNLGIIAWIGLFIATIGLLIISWPKRLNDGALNWKDAIPSAFFGLLSGFLFAICTNLYRVSVNAIEGHASLFSGSLAVLIAQIFQSILMAILLFYFARSGLYAAIRNWRESLVAGAGGAVASLFWFTALGLAPAALVKAVNLMVEIPASVLWGRFKLNEKLSSSKIIATFMIIIGVILAVLKA